MAEIHYMDLDKNNQENLTGDVSIVTNNEPLNYVSFDGNGIDLEKSEKKTFLSEEDYDGYRSLLSNIAGVVPYGSEYPGIKLSRSDGYFDFKKGITISFYGDCCDEFEVEYKYENSVAGSSKRVTYPVTKNKFHFVPPEHKIEIDGIPELSQIYSIEFYFTLTKLPMQYVKVEYIKFGEVVVFDKLKSIELLEEINVLSDDLPINSLNYSVVLKEPVEFDAGNPMNVYSNGRYYGTFYLDDAEQTAKQIYEVKAFNSIKITDDTEYREWQLGTEFRHFQEDIKKLTGIQIIPPDYSIGAFGNIPINSCRYAICQQAFACRLMVDGSRSDRITLRPIPETVSSVITTADKRIIGEAKYTKTKPITSAKIQYATTYTIDTLSDETVQLDNPANERIVYYFNEPVEVKDEQPEGITVFSSAGNYVDFISTKANISLNVFKIKYLYNNFTVINDSVSETASNEKDFSKLNLRGVVFDENGWGTDQIEAKTKDIKNYMKSVGTVKAKIVLEDEKVGDLIQIETAFDGIKTGIITSMSIGFGYKDVAEIEVLEWPNG